MAIKCLQESNGTKSTVIHFGIMRSYYVFTFLLMNVVLSSLHFDVNYKLHDKLRLNHNTEWRTFSLALFIDCTVTPSNPVFQYHITFAARRLIYASSSFMTKLIGTAFNEMEEKVC
jgi:hypothetical protein